MDESIKKINKNEKNKSKGNEENLGGNNMNKSG